MARTIALVTPIEIGPDLWASSIMPEGILEHWLRPNGCMVEAGEPVARVRVEDALHDMVAPARGKLRAELKTNSVIEPGTVIGSVLRTL